MNEIAFHECIRKAKPTPDSFCSKISFDNVTLFYKLSNCHESEYWQKMAKIAKKDVWVGGIK